MCFDFGLSPTNFKLHSSPCEYSLGCWNKEISVPWSDALQLSLRDYDIYYQLLMRWILPFCRIVVQTTPSSIYCCTNAYQWAVALVSLHIKEEQLNNKGGFAVDCMSSAGCICFCGFLWHLYCNSWSSKVRLCNAMLYLRLYIRTYCIIDTSSSKTRGTAISSLTFSNLPLNFALCYTNCLRMISVIFAKCIASLYTHAEVNAGSTSFLKASNTSLPLLNDSNSGILESIFSFFKSCFVDRNMRTRQLL